MNTLLYKIKNKIFRLSKEASKLRRPSHEELLNYKYFKRRIDNKFILSFGAGRCGQNWFAKIFNSHSNWIGTCERFSDFEAFYRFISFHNIPINKDDFFEILNLARNRDMAKYQNTLIASPYFSFGVEELSKKLNPDYLIFNLRDPVNSVESFYKKGWYLNFENKDLKNIKNFSFYFSNNLTRSFSRIIPRTEFFNEWMKLTRIGKITWFWAISNSYIFNNFNKIEDIDKFFLRLEDIDQNYDFYQHLSDKFSFNNKMSKKKFFNVINKAPNKGPSDKYKYSNWSNLEKKEFNNIIDKIFPHYDKIKTNI